MFSRNLILWFIVGLLALNSKAQAEDCAAQVTTVVDQLEAEVVALTSSQREKTEALIARLCGGPEPARVADNESKENDAADATFLGIEIHKADADSKGNERLRKKR